jgi:hypothetical protein
MLALLKFFIDLALLRRGPQDLPASPALLALLAGGGLLVGTANGMRMFGGAAASFGANLLDLGLSMLLLYALLQVRGHTARWLQAASAFFGLGLRAGLILLLVRGPAEQLGVSELAMLVELVLAVWLHVALGSVLRHALGIPLLAGVIIMLSYTVLAFNLIIRIFPLVTST